MKWDKIGQKRTEVHRFYERLGGYLALLLWGGRNRTRAEMASLLASSGLERVGVTDAAPGVGLPWQCLEVRLAG